MDEPFFLPVTFNGAEHEFETVLQTRGYIPRFIVDVDGTQVYFEKDEEGGYRAVIPPEGKGKIPPVGLLEAIAATIVEVLK